MVKVMTLYLRNQNNENSKYVLMYIKHHIRTLYTLGIRFKIDVYDLKRIKKEQKKLKQNGINYFPSALIGNKLLSGVDNILKFLESVSVQYRQQYQQNNQYQDNMADYQNEGYPKVKRVEDCTNMSEYADMLNNPDYFKQFISTDGKDEDEINDSKLKSDINSRAAKMEEHRKLRSSPKGMAQAMDNEIEQIHNELNDNRGAGNQRNKGADNRHRKAKTNQQTYDKMNDGGQSYDAKMANSSDQNGAQLVEDWVSSVMNMTD